MDNYRTPPHYSPQRPLQEPPFRDRDVSSTAYYGAAGNVDNNDEWNLPTVRLDRNGYEDIRLTDRTLTPPIAREGLGSRLLSSISNGSPTAAALTRSGSVLHSRAKSWAAQFPILNPSAATTPEKQQNRQSRIFGDLFSGESAPVQLGVPTSPTKEKDEADFFMEYRPALTERPSARSQQRKTSATTITPTNKSKASWFSRKPSAVKPVPASQDEFVNINIHNNLFPHGPADPLSPQAFNDLLLNATRLLQRMQDAYKEKVDYISSIQPEMDAQKEEREEALTRSEHLRMQLEDIGRQHDEQKKTSEELIIQLSLERVQLSEAREAAAKTVRLVRREAEDAERGDRDDGSSDSDGHRDRRKRGSAGSASDSGFESDADTASVFSTGMETTPLSARLPPPSSYLLQHSILRAEMLPPTSRQPLSRTSTATSQQTFASSSATSSRPQQQQQQRHDGRRVPLVGENASWTSMEQLRSENHGLRLQMEEMRQTVQGCIDLVGGMTVS